MGVRRRSILEFWIFLSAATQCQTQRVTEVTPHWGSRGGETRLTIYGADFSGNQFSQNDDPNTGNMVYLVSSSGSEYTCPVLKDGTTEIQIMCYTPRGMPEEDHYVRVVVDGVRVPDRSLCGGYPKSDKCTYKPTSSHTPIISSLKPQHGLPGEMLTMKGKMFTDRYGSNIESATNGRTEKLLRVYAGVQDCSLKEGDEFYGLSLESESSDFGFLTCKTQGTSVGFYNVSFIVESPYGRSLSAGNLYRVSYNDQIYLYQIYTDITSISQSSGSVAGGLSLTILGDYFDDRAPYTLPRAYVGDTECKITDVVVDSHIICTVAPDPEYTKTKFPGNRGVNFEYWTGVSGWNDDLDSILTLTSSDNGYHFTTLDETYFYDTEDGIGDDYVTRMTSLFKPPHSGEYQFLLLADDMARLYIDGNKAVTSKQAWAASERITLNENTEYLLEVAHCERGGLSFIHLKAKFYDTKFTSAWTAKAEQEQQIISITSTVKYDVQELLFEQFSNQSHVEEVQIVDMEVMSEFRFGLYGVYTEPLNEEMSDVTIQTAISSLPIWGPNESVKVERNETSSSIYKITFQSKRGDFPDISVVSVPLDSNSVNYSVIEDIKGVPDLDTVALSLDGVVSAPFSVAGLTAKGLSSVVNGMFEAKCPDTFKNQAKHYESFEKATGLFDGSIVNNTDAFCGKYALKNPKRIYQKLEKDQGIMLFASRLVCFAYKGFLKNIIGIRYTYKNETTLKAFTNDHEFQHTFETDSPRKSETWYYTCVNIYSVVFDLRPSDVDHRLEEVWVYRSSFSVDAFVDSLYIGQQEPINDAEAHLRRLPPTKPNGAYFSAITVSAKSSNHYVVTLVPLSCGYNFPLFELENGIGVQNKGVKSSRNLATLVLNNSGGSGIMKVNRTSQASPPVTGYIDVTFNGKTRPGLKVILDAADFAKEIESLQDIGAMSVEKEGDCANFDLITTFLTLSGDLPQMTVTYGQLSGINAAGSITTRRNGGLFYDPLSGDMLSTVHSAPQVRLFINDVPTSCSGDCTFNWDSTVTPTVTSISPTSGTAALETSVVIEGTGFSDDTSEITVSIGGVVCAVTESSATRINCDVGNGPVGSHPVLVTVEGKGHASGHVEFTYTADITAIYPTAGSLGGGVRLTISGYGFRKDDINVNVGSSSCKIISNQADQIVCMVPPSSSFGKVNVSVEQNAYSMFFSGFTYDPNRTAIVKSVVPAKISVIDSIVTIAGTSFLESPTEVYVGGKPANIVNWTDSQIQIDIPAIDSGIQDILIDLPDGHPVHENTSKIPQVEVDLTVTGVCPLQGSLLGGTELTISGSGFGTDTSIVSVKVGSVGCDISIMTPKEIKCKIQHAGSTHRVTNKGIHRAFGVYYAFDRPYLTIHEGDFVHWSWETPVFVNDIAHAIIEVESPSSVRKKVDGFSSGTPTRNGQYNHQFNQAGIYYVWSGFVDIWGIKNYAGTVEVIPANSNTAEISVHVGAAEALYIVQDSYNSDDDSTCKSVTTGKSGCNDSLPLVINTSKFSFASWTCSTPIVDKIDRNNGTTLTDITVTGEGFSSKPYQNEITFGGYRCIVSKATETSLTCNLEKAGTPELGILHPIAVRVSNRGHALIRITQAEEMGLAVMPNIDNITPDTGSTAGGARLTISGFGFGDVPLVTIGGVNCKFIRTSYEQVVCQTPSFPMAIKDVELFAYVNNLPLRAECETSSGVCRYYYNPEFTPSVSSISPNSMTSNQTFVISGTSLGNKIAEVEVTIGSEQATVTFVNKHTIEVTIENIPAGDNEVQVRVLDYGLAEGSLSVYGTPTADTVLPSNGSIYGKTTITIRGNGFIKDKTTVIVGGKACEIQTISLSAVTCVTPAHAEASVNVNVISNDIQYPLLSFDYSETSTPTVSSINPSSGFPGDTITITGSHFTGGKVTVTLGESECEVTSSSSSEIQCTVGNHATGLASLLVHVNGLGASNNDVEFEYQLSIISIHPTKGGIAGGQIVVVSGTGFDSQAVVNICENTCARLANTFSSYTCRTPEASEQTCDVSVILNGLVKTLSSSYTYDASLTPTISGVEPTRGGTGGGTILTISGSGFGNTLSDVSVKIDNSVCTVSSVTENMIVCETGSHAGSKSSSVEVQISGNGIAKETVVGKGVFHYIDVWSSSFTWGGGPLPQAGDFVVIPAGMTLLLDTDTPVLSFLLIKGGKLIFDEKDIELQSNIIMITDGGVLQAGTEEQPFQHKAIITLHGHHRSKELPIYGTKVLAVRNGTLDLHGVEVPLTWTRLSTTAAAGTNTLELMDPVEWKVGDEIVIASTGHLHSQSENEKKTIQSISGDKRTLTLNSNLKADHISTEETFDETLVQFRAEIGLLTHNVVVRGNRDPQWDDVIKACPAGFDTGEFAVQTCFLGRFGDEIGSSQFGAMILVHAPVMNTHEAQARISYTEVTFAGQAFRLGRYPIHFHLNGDMSKSYVRGCSIHKAFNRAVNIHGTHNTLVEKTVIYDIMGGAFFLEDGIETGNTLQYNLAVFVIGSSSLLNDDVTPASFWVTNPNNTIQHNAAAGGTHFGYWYRMHNHPDGPSFTPNVCPRSTPLGVFRNNSAHSFGWYGLWIFEQYHPMKKSCSGGGPEPAVFESLFAWNNNKGAEAVSFGSLQFVNFVLVQNRGSGFEGKSISSFRNYGDDSPMVKNSLIVGTTTVIRNAVQGCTSGGIAFPYGRGFRVVNVTFVNFENQGCVTFKFTRIQGACTSTCGGFHYHTESLKFVNAANKVLFSWDWEAIILDKDGTLSGKSGYWTVLPTTGTLPPDCEAADFGVGVPTSICPPKYKWHRYSFNGMSPDSLHEKNFVMSNQYGNSTVNYSFKRLTHPLGWMCALLDGETYTFHFSNSRYLRNISFAGTFYDFEPGDFVIVKFLLRELPDRFTINGKTYTNATAENIDPQTAWNGQWNWDNTNKEIKFIVRSVPRSRREVSTISEDLSIQFSCFKCYYMDCIPPPDPDTVSPEPFRYINFMYWDDVTIWGLTDDRYMSNVGENGTRTPQDYENVKILYRTWVIVNMTKISRFGTLIIEGRLEFVDSPDAVYEIEADYIVIKAGRLIIGWPDDPFDGLATVTLRGNYTSSLINDELHVGYGPPLGTKAIGVFGGLDLFGKDVGKTWTLLAESAKAGTNKLVLAEQVGWSIGDDIVLGSTSFDPWQTETFTIFSIEADNKTLTLNSVLNYTHTVHTEVLASGEKIEVGAAVGLLSHNIKIIGEDYPDMYQDSYGARVIVGLIVDEGQVYTGYARLSNVEFYHTGQAGFKEEYDPRFSLAYLAVGTVNSVKPSTVTKCSFRHSFNTAVGAFGIRGLNITDNVIFGVLGNGIHTTSKETTIANNLVALIVSTDNFVKRDENTETHWVAGIEAIGASDLTLKDNLVTASERIGLHVPLLSCEDTSGSYSSNKLFANLIGALILSGDIQSNHSCVKMSGLTAWRSHDFGIYYQHSADFLSDDNLLIENHNGMMAIVTGPASISHEYEDKRVTVRRTTFVGETSSFDCDSSMSEFGKYNIKGSGKSRPSLGPGGGMVGLVFPNFNSATNKAPKALFIGIKNYNAIGGLTVLSDVTFANYSKSGCRNNYAITPNQASDDGQHPVHAERITLLGVDDHNKIFYQRPNIGKINSADCIDMDCDAFKKVMFKDLDGTFLGHVGTVIPQSEFEWNGDTRRGLGDYRIPKEMVTLLDGTRIPYRTIAPYQGIVRNKNCIYRPSWQAYECMDDINYEMLIIESMDSDTESRRLSPVAILSDGYMDLINGPQDHGWCSGYACRTRISTFMALVATDKEFLLHFTSTTPQHMRYRLLNVDQSEGIKLTVWYSRPNRLDVYVDGTFKIATNARIDGKGRYIITMPEGNEFEPQIANGTGTNYYDRDRGEITVVVKGTQQIDVITKDTIIVSFGLPALTVVEFYGDNIIENLAAFLNIPLTKVRIMNVVSASGNGRRKRSTSGVTVVCEIGDEPSADLNSTVPDSIGLRSLQNLTSELVNECQAGNISQTLNTSAVCGTVSLPSTDPSKGTIYYTTPVPDHLFFYAQPKPIFEGLLLETQPKIRVADVSKNIVTQLGTAEYPWRMSVSVRAGTGHSSATLFGTLSVPCVDGWFNFTGLGLTHVGTGYILDFVVTYPENAGGFVLASDPFDVPGIPLSLHAYTSLDVVQAKPFEVVLELQDLNTGDVITDIGWRHHTWEAEASLLGSTQYSNLSGTLTPSFDYVNGRVTFPDLALSGFGVFYVQFRVISTPSYYNITLNHRVLVKQSEHATMISEDQYDLKIKFNDDFNTLLPTLDKKHEFEQMIFTQMANTWFNVQLLSGTIYKGSIMVEFTIAGSYIDLNDTVDSLCESIFNKTVYTFYSSNLTLAPFLTVNNETLYGVSCGEILNGGDSGSGLAPYLIAILATTGSVLLIALVAVIIYRFKVKPTRKPQNILCAVNSEMSMEDSLVKQRSFASIGLYKNDSDLSGLSEKTTSTGSWGVPKPTFRTSWRDSRRVRPENEKPKQETKMWRI